MSRRQEIDDAIRQTKDMTQQIERRLDKMETVLIIREPSSTVAAEAYDGLRRQILTALSERQAHVTQLVQLASALEGGADVTTLTSMVKGWLESANVISTSDAGSSDADLLFQMIEDLGGTIEVLAPAYVDASTNRVIRQGRIRRAAPHLPPVLSMPSAQSEATDPTDPAEADPAALAGHASETTETGVNSD